jgi:hypothetical protein
VIDRTMTEDAMLRHVLIAYLREELDAMILCQATSIRGYVDAQLDDEMGSRNVALEQSAAFLAWLTIALTARNHLEDGPCGGSTLAEPCDIHALHAELDARGVRDWPSDPNEFFAGREFYPEPQIVLYVDEVQHYMRTATSGSGKTMPDGTSFVIPDHPADDPFFNSGNES